MSGLAGYSKVGETLRSAISCHVWSSEFTVISSVVFFLSKDFVPANRGCFIGSLLLENSSGIWVVCWKLVSVTLFEMDNLFFYIVSTSTAMQDPVVHYLPSKVLRSGWHTK